MFLLSFSFSVSSFDYFSSISAISQQLLVKHQFKFNFFGGRGGVFVIEFLFLLLYTLAYWEIIFHCSNSECYICEAMLSPLVRNIPSAVVSTSR